MVRKAVIRHFLLFLVGIVQVNTLCAQDSTYRWAIKPYYSVLQYTGEIENQLFKFNRRNDGGGIGMVRYLSPSFNLVMGADFNMLNFSGLVDETNYRINGYAINPNIMLQYKFANDKLLPASKKLQPYVGFGFDYYVGQTKGNSFDLQGDEFKHTIDEVSYNLIAGVTYKITPRTGIFMEANVRGATTDELDGSSFNRKNDKFRGAKLGLIIQLGGEKDSDHDGVPDSKDDCPDTPFGVKVDEKGCPEDRDKDGIYDYEDDCPDDPGLPEFNGCPDRDGDGIPDKKDDCPDLPGIPKYNGCPDSDGDGVIDPKDLCPDTQPGLVVDEYGCPLDSDGDGLTDDVDQCPDEFGPLEYLGCPEPPDVGRPSNMKETPPEVYFETDQYELSPEMETEMNEVVKFLFENPMMNIRLYGQADPRGTDDHNKVLSARRVEAVKKYLMKKGIPENRILVRALGETQVVEQGEGEENMTVEQRFRKYRRVMFETFFFMR